MSKSAEICSKLRLKYRIFDEHTDYIHLDDLRVQHKNPHIKEPILDFNKVTEIPLPPDYDDEIVWYDGFMST